MQTIVRLLIVLTCGAFCASGWSADNAAQRLEAAQLFEAGNYLDALPVYEALAAADPTSAQYAERLAYCLMVKFEILPEGPKRTAAYERAKREAQRAQSLGDDSNMLHIILERVNQPLGVPLEAAMQAAEAAFSNGDLERALAGYQEIAARDPTSYEALLYSGDVYFRMKKLAAAGEWFQKAIALNPNIETAYRYWGDALMQSGQAEQALHKFIDAVIAEPYSRRPWMGLQQWAGRTGHELAHPRIDTPPAPKSKSNDAAAKDVTVHTDEAMLADPAGSKPWFMYSVVRGAWRSKLFSEKFPDEKHYRHSLGEEVAAYEALLAVLAESDPPMDANDESLRNVKALAMDQMLEAYVLISAADEGIAQDYAAYRDEHRDVLHAYIEKYVVRGKPNSGD